MVPPRTPSRDRSCHQRFALLFPISALTHAPCRQAVLRRKAAALLLQRRFHGVDHYWILFLNAYAGPTYGSLDGSWATANGSHPLEHNWRINHQRA
jgi:hypothetical protein